MTWVLLALLVVAAAGIAMAGALATRARRDRASRLQVVPGVASRAPVAWAGAHSPEAKLHRRLGDAVRSMRAQPTWSGPMFAEQRSALEAEAMRIDDRLVAIAALHGPQRAPAIEQVAGLVDRYEKAVADLVTASLGDPASLETVITESEIRLQALEEARAEVEQIDRRQQG